MINETLHMHYVCTIEEALELINNHSDYWVANCGCREMKGKCEISRMDICLAFYSNALSSSSKRNITRKEVEEIINEAKSKNLVTRPFRDDKDKSKTVGVCFCCTDCCGYFLNNTEVCDKGKYIESTKMEVCTDCGECVEYCYFGARKIEKNKLTIYEENCYGCGICTYVCPEKCIKMLIRE